MLCDKIKLNRISSVDHESYIQDAAQAKCGELANEMVLNKIYKYTQLHPFYLNLLCNEVWKQDKAPTVDDILSSWKMCHEVESRRIVAELEKLTKNQQDILKTLSIISTHEPTGQKFLSEVGLSLSSMRQGIKSLLSKDMIEQVTQEDPALPNVKLGQYRVLDPLIAYALLSL